jgi:uncharacterized protein YcbK (DUF882 family)
LRFVPVFLIAVTTLGPSPSSANASDTALATPVLVSQAVASESEGRLSLFHTHTKERLDIVYRRGGTYLPAALEKLDWFLRDHRTGDTRHYDPHVFDILRDLVASLGRTSQEIQIICGYRTPASNQYLRTHTTGVAEKSQHMLATAIDIRIPGLKTAVYRDAALALKRGGVGYYPASNFIHVDVGPVRRW